MKKLRWFAVCGFAALSMNVAPAYAQGVFRTALAKQHENLTITCYLCHVKGEDKDVRNDFGKMIAKELEGKDVSARLEAAKEEDADTKEQVTEEVVNDFLAAFKKIEAKTSPSGKTYGALLKAGELDGTSLK